MNHQPVTTAPPECVTGCGHDGVVRVIDRGGAVDMCLLDVQALLGTCEGRIALLIDDGLERWERGDDRTDGSGPDLPDWPEEKEN